MVAYELPFVAAAIVAAVRADSLELSTLAHTSAVSYSVSGALALLVAAACLPAKLTVVPFDLAEAETELTGGALIEYSGPPLAAFKLTRAMMLFTMPTVLLVLFGGGFHDGVVWGVLKWLGLFVLVVVVRNTTPRVRVDQAFGFFWGVVSWVAVAAIGARGGGVVNAMNRLASFFLTRSLNAFHLAGSACNNCDIEVLDALTPKYDLERFGITLVGSIRHADLILLSGVFNKKSAARVKTLIEQAPKPFLVVAIGGCPASGLMFRDSYNWDEPVGNYIPIDAYVPGCPPKPEAIISAVLKLIEKVRG